MRKNENIKWIVLGVSLFLFFFLFSASIVFFVTKLMKGEAYQLSLQEISASAEVLEAIGNPITPGWFVLGSINTSGPDGSAAIEYSVEGAKSSAQVYVYATKSAGEWILDNVIVEVALTEERITIVERE